MALTRAMSSSKRSIAVAGDVAVVAATDLAWRVRETIPDRFALAIDIPGAFDLIGRRRGAPDEIIREPLQDPFDFRLSASSRSWVTGCPAPTVSGGALGDRSDRRLRAAVRSRTGIRWRSWEVRRRIPVLAGERGRSAASGRGAGEAPQNQTPKFTPKVRGGRYCERYSKPLPTEVRPALVRTFLFSTLSTYASTYQVAGRIQIAHAQIGAVVARLLVAVAEVEGAEPALGLVVRADARGQAGAAGEAEVVLVDQGEARHPAHARVRCPRHPGSCRCPIRPGRPAGPGSRWIPHRAGCRASCAESPRR